jgi:metal-responsive CopG/Arc/MetJ family transcriptional regulator
MTRRRKPMSIPETVRRERGHRVVVAVRLPQATLAELDQRCTELGASRSEYVAEMLAVALGQRS